MPRLRFQRERRLAIELLQPHGATLAPGPFLARFQYLRRALEIKQVKEAASLAAADQVRIHLLTDSGHNNYGFIAINIAMYNNLPSVIISYLFTSAQYRGVPIPDLDGMKVSEYLTGWLIRSATEIRATVPLRYIALLPADDKLVSFYEGFGFKNTQGGKGWMSMVVPKAIPR